MELWIRTQDKTTLIRSYEIYIVEHGKDSYVIRAKRTSHILGAYNSFERALEVLDEIQEAMMLNEDYDYSGRAEVNTIRKCLIYEMPKD